MPGRVGTLTTMNGKHCQIIVKPRVYHVLTIDECAAGNHERGLRAGHNDFEGWLAQLVLRMKGKGYSVTVERNDKPN